MNIEKALKQLAKHFEEDPVLLSWGSFSKEDVETMDNAFNEAISNLIKKKMEDRNIEAMSEKQVAELVSDKTDKEIIESLEIPFEIYDNKLLVKPLKPENIKKRVEVLDEKKNKGKMPQEVMETKRVTKSVQTDYREGIVLAAGPNAFIHSHNSKIEPVKVEIGDKVVFHKNLIDRSWFDLFKDSLLLRTYDLEAKSLR